MDSKARAADTHDILAPYLELCEPRLVLDVRPEADFHAAHLSRSYHLHPVSALKSRYSYLPPRGVPFLVLANEAQYVEVVDAFQHTTAARLVFLSAPDRPGCSSTCSTSENTVCDSREFFACASQRDPGLVASSNSLKLRLATSKDTPTLLFKPSNAVRRVVDAIESRSRLDGEGCIDRRVLDLGCGAARDLAWILHRSRSESVRKGPGVAWSGVGLDNWKAALSRAQQLVRDLYLDDDSQVCGEGTRVGCEGLIWAKCDDDGYIDPLFGTGKGKPLDQHATLAPEETQTLARCHTLGLGPVMRAHHATATLPNPTLEDAGFDLILVVRFHPRSLLARISRLVRPGGCILLSHFTTMTEQERSALRTEQPAADIDYESPPIEGRVHPQDPQALVETWNSDLSAPHNCCWRVAENILETIEDGRIVRSVTFIKSQTQ
ncbi:hypothetical protein BCV70DRAFT_201921 [Testicularia cyperi]|uniref:Rhodanese domain-containing protein n=1 Tax=Testicularia cyperi TaxID=1882483 RepID=A0A317XMQ1_9BASI|nr:hypothetical protein BCV70DRAFT_201921 [Testicularia cyperi]